MYYLIPFKEFWITFTDYIIQNQLPLCWLEAIWKLDNFNNLFCLINDVEYFIAVEKTE